MEAQTVKRTTAKDITIDVSLTPVYVCLECKQMTESKHGMEDHLKKVHKLEEAKQ